MNTDPGMNGEDEKKEGTDELSMEQLMESSLQSLKEGEVVRGVVVAVNTDEVLVDIGYKCEGSVPITEFSDPDSGEVAVEVNDEVEVFVERLDEAEGRVRLSRNRAAQLKTWRSIEDAFKAGTAVQGRVLERVKGGLSVDIGVRAFLPGSLVDLRPNRRLEDYLDQDIEARIISFDRRRANVVLSRKAILEEERGQYKEETMAALEEGKLVSGTVKNLTDYGVFIDLGGLDGLLHITDISWGRVGHPSEYFSVGDEVDVVVLRFDRERERVSLGYKQRFEDPWILVPEKYPVGKRVEGKVVSIVDYGAFVVIEEGVEGLIHVSEMSWTKKIKNPRSILEIGQDVEVVVSEVDAEKRRLSLSLRATEPNPWEQVAESYTVGAKIHGVVRNLTDFGAFVEIVPGVDGLVHISDMSWTRRINHPSEIVQKGDEVEAVITSIDAYNQRISLSMKELLPNEWEEYANAHGVGDVVGGVITNVTDFGVFVELSPGVEGLCHISEIDRDEGLALAEKFESGHAVRCRVLRIDWSESRIGLTMRGIDQEDAEEELAAEASTGGGAETAMAAALRAGGLVDDSAEEAAEVPVPEEVEVQAVEPVDEEEAAQEAAEVEPEEGEAQAAEPVEEAEAAQEAAEVEPEEGEAQAAEPVEEAEATQEAAEVEPEEGEAQAAESVAEEEATQEAAEVESEQAKEPAAEADEEAVKEAASETEATTEAAEETATEDAADAAGEEAEEVADEPVEDEATAKEAAEIEVEEAEAPTSESIDEEGVEVEAEGAEESADEEASANDKKKES